VSSKFTGDLEDYKITLLSDQQIIWAMSLGGVFRGYVVGAITFLVGTLFMFITEGHGMSMTHPWAAVFFLTVGGLAFAQLGIAVAFWAKSFDQLSAVTSFVLLPLLYLGGVFFSIENLHPLWRKLAQLNPLLYMVNGVRYGFCGAADVDVFTAMMVSLLFLAVMFVLSLVTLRNSSFARW